jgi:lambda repressor-like predicted transcriptional regulator
MATATKKKTVGKLDGNLMTSEVFAQMLHAYLECSDEVQAAICDMAEVVNDPNATHDERRAALSTIAEALFPSHYNGVFGVDLDECESAAPRKFKDLLREMDEQEAAFSERVNAALSAKGMTQEDLAAAIGVGQSAISMMLSRKCRPQRRTVERVALALDLTPSDLWPDVHDDE